MSAWLKVAHRIDLLSKLSVLRFNKYTKSFIKHYTLNKYRKSYYSIRVGLYATISSREVQSQKSTENI